MFKSSVRPASGNDCFQVFRFSGLLRFNRAVMFVGLVIGEVFVCSVGAVNSEPKDEGENKKG